MSASVLWNYVDLFGIKGGRKLAFADEPISIVAHATWSENERRETGAFVTSPESLIAALNEPPPVHPDPSDTSLLRRLTLRASAPFANSEAFANAVVRNDPEYLKLDMYDHLTNDWHDVLRQNFDRPMAIFMGEWCTSVPSQRWAQSVIPGALLHVYSKAEQDDHFVRLKNPAKFTEDLRYILER